MAASVAFGVTATGALYFVGRGDWRLGAAALHPRQHRGERELRVLRVAAAPHRTRRRDRPRLDRRLRHRLLRRAACCWPSTPCGSSTRTWFGIPDARAATRLSFLSAAVWWAVFSDPAVPARAGAAGGGAGARRASAGHRAAAFTRLAGTLRDLRGYRQAFLLLLAFLLYNDGIQTIIRMGAAYGIEIGISRGRADRRHHHDPVRGSSLRDPLRRPGRPFRRRSGCCSSPSWCTSWSPSCGYRMKTAADFFVLAFLRGDRAGRQPGPQPLALRDHDPALALGRVLRVLGRVRQVRQA